MANRKMDQKLYLHRTCILLEMVDLGKTHPLFRPQVNECQGMSGM